MNNDYTNPSTISTNTWSSAGQPSNPSTSATSFNNYTINTKWGSHNSSQSSTPTNPSTLTATFPSLVSSGIPPLYPSISAQSSNSNRGGAPSPFAHHGGIPPHQNTQIPTPTNQTSAYAFNAAQTLNQTKPTLPNAQNAANNNNTTNPNSSNTSLNNTQNPSSRPSTAGQQAGGISHSSSSSSLTGLTGGINKLHINTNTLQSYNPYSTGSGFTPYAGGHTPTGNNSAANTPNPGNSTGATPTGFRFSGYPNPYSQIATPPTPANGLLGGGQPFAQARFNPSNALQQQAIQNNLQNNIHAMGLNYRIGKLPTLSANNSLNALPNLSNPPSMNNNASLTQQTSNNTGSGGLPTPQNQQNTISSNSATDNNNLSKKINLNSNAAPYQPRTQANAPPTTLTNVGNLNVNVNPADPMKLQQQQHQKQADRVPYSYPSYAEAVNKVNSLNIANINNQLQAQLQQAQIAQQKAAMGGVGSIPTDKQSNDSDDAKAKLTAESEEAIQKLNPVQWPSNPKHAKFYVIKSFGEDDVHKSIKYNLWCSTERGNRKLDEAFNESKRINAANNNQLLDDNVGKAGAQQKKKNKLSDADIKDLVDPRDTIKGCPVYLFFSVNRSGCFCGMAQMISNYYKDRHFGSWVQDGKWQGSFIVKWIYVKDIPNKDLKDIQLPNNDNRPVTFSRDTQEIPFGQGIEMLRRFIKYEPKTNILQDFKYYDDRERDIKQKRTQQMIMQQLQQQQMGGGGNMNNMGGPMGQQQQQNNGFGGGNNNSNQNNNRGPSNPMNSYGGNKGGGNIQDVRNGPYKRGRYNSGYNNNNENYNNNYGGNNNSQIEGYNNHNSHRGGGGYKGGYNNNRRYNNGYNNNRRYHSKNDRNNSYHNSYRGGGGRGRGRGGYRNNYDRNNNNNQNYGNIQILSKKSTPGNDDRASNNGLDDDQQNSPNRGSRNRNRNRWVPK